MVIVGLLVYLGRLYFLLDSNENWELKGHGQYGTIIVTLVNKLTIEFV